MNFRTHAYSRNTKERCSSVVAEPSRIYRSESQHQRRSEDRAKDRRAIRQLKYLPAELITLPCVEVYL